MSADDRDITQCKLWK